MQVYIKLKITTWRLREILQTLFARLFPTTKDSGVTRDTFLMI